jgi:hypothetical protein
VDRIGGFGDGDKPGLSASAVAASAALRSPSLVGWATNGAETGAALSVASDRARTLDATAIDSAARTRARTNGRRTRR